MFVKEYLLLFSLEPFVFPSPLLKKLKIKMYKTIIFPVVLYERGTWSLTEGKQIENV
jgi:hypothetical protein